MPRLRDRSRVGGLAAFLVSVAGLTLALSAGGQAPAAGGSGRGVGAGLGARAAAGAALPTGPLVGFGDTQPNMFTSPYFTVLHVHIARVTVSWDAVINNR